MIFWLFVALALVLFAFGFLAMRNSVTPAGAYVGLCAMVASVVLLLVLLILGTTGARAAGRDSFVLAMESAFGMMPGGTRVVPQCSCTVEYLGTRSQGHGIFAVLVKRLD